MDLCNLEEIKPLLRRHGFQFSKSMGQNFLIAPWVPEETAQASGAGAGAGVLEIGPGIGSLTVALAARAEQVLAVELDKSLLPVLKETLAGTENVEVLAGDILKRDISELCRQKLPQAQRIVCANLPYNITTPVIVALVESGSFSSITVMIQREVALRICAAPGTPDYGAFSVFCQYHANCQMLFDVPPECFHPTPKVTSGVIRMDLLSKPPVPVSDKALFFRVVRASFAQRRKTLVNALHASFGNQHSKEAICQMVEDCGLSKTIRGERLGLSEFAQLAKKFEK